MPKCSMTVLILALLGSTACSVEPTGNDERSASATAASENETEPRRYTIFEKPGGAPASLRFVPLAERLPDASVQLDNGVVVEAADWPATLIATLDGSICTASLIGPRALLTAAHCVDLGKQPGAAGPLATGGTVVIQNRTLDLACEMDPTYSSATKPARNTPRRSTDYALCTLSAPINVAQLRPESISTSALAVNNPVLLAGYGCTNIVIRTENGEEKLTYTEGDDKLRMGDERISFVGDRAGQEQVGVWATTLNDGREPTLCPGDSGGPVFQGATLADQRRSRRVVAVNSAVGWGGRPPAYRYYSFLSPLSTNSFRNFVAGFVRRNTNQQLDGPKLIICGYNQNPGVGGCRA